MAEKKTPKKAAPKPAKKAEAKPAKRAEKKLVGKITHYFTNIGVAVIELTGELKEGEKISIEGATTKVEQKADSMQIDRKPVEKAGAGQSIGLKTKDRVREGDLVYKIVEG